MESKRMFVLVCLLIIPAGAWSVKTAVQLSNMDIADLTEQQIEQEKRLQALQQVTGAEVDGSDQAAKVSGTPERVGSESVVAVRIDEPTEKPAQPGRAEPREGEKTFAGKLSAKGAKQNQAQSLLAAVDRGEADMSELVTFARANPGYRGVRIMLARMQILADSPDQALKTLAPLTQAIHEAEHPDWQPWFWQGTAYLRQGELEQARRNLEVALSKARENANVWVQLAVVEQEFQNHAGALQYLAIAEQLDPKLGEVYLNRAYSLERLGRLGPAAQAYRSFLLADSHSGSGPTRAQVARRISDLALSH